MVDDSGVRAALENHKGRLVTEQELADMLVVTVRILQEQRRRHQPPGVLGIRIGQQVRYDPVELLAWWDRLLDARYNGE